jgi:phage anti-repressor protein
MNLQTDNDMEELIKITEQDGRRAVSARELHAFLESKQRFADWIKNRIEQYGFVENEDFATIHKIMKRENARRQGATKLIEYALTIDMAKELAMVEGNEKGRQARRYFIERDKELRAMEREKLNPGRYDASRNILPGVHSPEARMIGEHSIWTILIAGVLPGVQKL